jgi:hypothetical protein
MLQWHVCSRITERISVIFWHAETPHVQWKQNNSELGWRHSKRGREGGNGKGEQDGKESLWACIEQLKTFISHLILTQSVAFRYTDFYTALYFVNQRNYRPLAVQAHDLTRTRYFYSINIIISHPIVQVRTGLSLRMCYRFAVFLSLPRVHV